jgi:hypothetical protein
MIGTGLVRCGGVLVAIATLSACGTLRQAQGDIAPSSAALQTAYLGKTLFVNGRAVTAARANLSAPLRYATMPNHPPLGRHREYIFSDYGTYASIFDYPKSTEQIGSIPGDGGQGCTNTLYGYGNGIFWDVAGETQIIEYKVPKTRIKQLSTNLGMPSSCAMNADGDLAVGILVGSGEGDVVIYKNATGSGTAYSTPLVEEFFDGYDNDGNLFADGFSSSGFFELVELPKGSSKAVGIKTSNTVQFPGSVQWDGTYLTVFDQETNSLYQYTVNGTTATLKGTVTFKGSSDCAQTWIVKGLIYCADAGTNAGEVFKYPAGGSIVATLQGTFDLPLGTTAADR